MNIARSGDLVGGGLILATASTVFVNGVPVARLGDLVTPHGKKKHKNAVLITASSSLIVEGKPVCRIGDLASCGHPISSGSVNVVNNI